MGDLSRLNFEVTQSHNLVVLLTPGVLTRPWCLVEIVTAVRNDINLVPVMIVRPGLDFKFPNDDFYEDLLQGVIVDPEFMSVQGIEMSEVANAIQKLFVKIAVTFSPHKAVTIRQAEVE